MDMMRTMKRFLLLLPCSAALLCGAELTAVHSVYVLPMGHGLDQYLANRLTNEHIFQVVTDPKLADAVFTDRIGAAFEDRLADLAPPPKPVAPPPTDADAAKPHSSGLLGDTVNKLSNPATSSTFGRAKGTLFLVDVKSHEVIWSTYESPKGTDSSDLDHSASDIVSRLKRALKPPAK